MANSTELEQRVAELEKRLSSTKNLGIASFIVALASGAAAVTGTILVGVGFVESHRDTFAELVDDVCSDHYSAMESASGLPASERRSKFLVIADDTLARLDELRGDASADNRRIFERYVTRKRLVRDQHETIVNWIGNRAGLRMEERRLRSLQTEAWRQARVLRRQTQVTVCGRPPRSTLE